METLHNQFAPEELFLKNLEEPAMPAVNYTEVVKRYKEALKKGTILSGICERCFEDGTLIIDLEEGVKGFIPREEVSYIVEEDGLVHLGKCRTRVGLKVQYKVKEVKAEKDKEPVFILSRKAAMEEIRDRYAKSLQTGMKIKGVITGLQPYGAFIDIGGDVPGILAVADISNVYVRHPQEIFNVGDVVEVVITGISYDKTNNLNLNFSRKELLPGWETIDACLRKGETCIGTVKNPCNTGMYVELPGGFEGIADFVPNKKFEYGDKARVTIERIDKAKNRIRLKFVV